MEGRIALQTIGLCIDKSNKKGLAMELYFKIVHVLGGVALAMCAAVDYKQLIV